MTSTEKPRRNAGPSTPIRRRERPASLAATDLAYSEAFIRAVAVAIMSVALEETADDGPDRGALRRAVVGNPTEQAGRFAIACATDPAVVADASDGTVTLETLVPKVREVWSVMAGVATANTAEP